jgi:hypothetical protein
MGEKKVTIATAATRYKGKYYTGWRHCFIGQQMLRDGVCEAPFPGGKDQAFLTSEGKWVDRKEALKIARESGQCIRKCGDPNNLYSEELWDINGVPYTNEKE